MLLTDLKAGESAKIVEVSCEKALKTRLITLGVFSGVKVTIMRYAPFNGPIQISIKGYFLAIRRSQAKKITVEKCNA